MIRQVVRTLLRQNSVSQNLKSGLLSAASSFKSTPTVVFIDNLPLNLTRTLKVVPHASPYSQSALLFSRLKHLIKSENPIENSSPWQDTI